MRKFVLAALTTSVMACGPGSVNPLTFIQPEVRLHHLAVKNVGLSGGTLDVVLAFHNPNKLSVQGTRLTAAVDIEGSHFGDVELTDPFELAASDTTLVSVPLTFRWSEVAGAARSVLDYGAVNYSIKGHFSVLTATCKECQIPFSGQGNVPLLRR
jgi:LEA14-like dessication related protein